MAIAWKETPQLPKAEGRIEAIDLARGIAIGLMIVSHSVSGLVGHGADSPAHQVFLIAVYYGVRGRPGSSVSFPR